MVGTSTKKVRKPSKRSKLSPLPSQYGFTPRTTEPPPRGNRGAGPMESDFPPPRQLFEESTPRTQPRAASTPLSQPAPPPQPRGSQTSANHTEAPEGPDEDEPVPNSPFPVEPNMSEDQTRLLNALLSQTGRERYTMSLSPTFEPGTMWDIPSLLMILFLSLTIAGTSTKKVRKPSKRSKPSPLPSQYGFTPRTTEPPPRGNRGAGPTVSDYPPPRQLFEESTPRTQPRADSTPLSQPAPPPQPRGSQTSANNTEAPEGPDEVEPVPNSPFPVEPNLSEDQTRLLNALLSQPGRERYTMRAFLPPSSLEPCG
ncbi:hypothetical protein F2Q69_00053042 [Brassica cretica]|uniref:Uncharacterized protein n=1 Tax=Brassica cretica TaxID=69181 RepID=A0A8S9MNF0_BRACR|nr:hypothetical protein F2Q69_00053042 [Brassica cretica]